MLLICISEVLCLNARFCCRHDSMTIQAVPLRRAANCDHSTSSEILLTL